MEADLGWGRKEEVLGVCKQLVPGSPEGGEMGFPRE